MPDVFTVLNNIVDEVLGFLPKNSYVSIAYPKRTLNIEHAIDELVDGWIRGVDLVVLEIFPMKMPQRLLQKLVEMFENVLLEIARSSIASYELAYTILRTAAALCIAAGDECRKLGVVMKARIMALDMVRKARMLKIAPQHILHI